MENIVKSEIQAATGCSVGDLDWDSIINTAITTTPSIINAANGGGSNSSSGGGSTVVGGDPATVSPGYRPITTTAKSSPDYLPWIIGGAAVLLLFMVMTNDKKK